ncbi:hypothetical protein E2C01_079084 [Portunus trituberculatus]|uniref:Uncharacterized protein n=1 Tax=Portunus trituberculatus TaxID=210409 RepID=A0A5B7ISC3_PORTR|nr:hypothetical protein [Portunus trituberculatus]
MSLEISEGDDLCMTSRLLRGSKPHLRLIFQFSKTFREVVDEEMDITNGQTASRNDDKATRRRSRSCQDCVVWAAECEMWAVGCRSLVAVTMTVIEKG